MVDHSGIDDALGLPLFSPDVIARPGTVQTAPGHTPGEPLFRGFKEVHFRLFGVPDDLIAQVSGLTDAEAIWDLPLRDHVKWTLADILTSPDGWQQNGVFNPRRLLYRANADELEGYCQGRIRQLLLNLNPEQERLVALNPRGPLLIRGVAGSGKTTIGLYRAKRIAEQAGLPGAPRVLMLTYNRTLARALGEFFVEIYGEQPANVEVGSLYDWILDRLLSDSRRRIASNDQREGLLAGTITYLRQTYNLRDLPQYLKPPILSAEFSYLKGRGINSLEEYLRVERFGRRLGLREESRRVIWDGFEYYCRALEQKGLIEYADLGALALARLDENDDFDGYYNAVVVDEAQDLPPMALRVARRLVIDRKRGSGLTLLADPAQSIYYRGVPWREADVNVVGSRSQELARNFRNTTQILEAARGVIQRCQSLRDANEYIPPEAANRPGPRPVIVACASEEEEAEFVLQEILRLCEAGQYRPGDFAVICLRNDRLGQLGKFFDRKDLPCAYFRDDEFRVLENEIKLITMHSSKGLEFPVVFLVGVDDGVIPRSSSVKIDDQDELDQQRRLLYVSMTRAAERLYITHLVRQPSRFLHDIEKGTIVSRRTPAAGP